jgi:hypothetical protein
MPQPSDYIGLIFVRKLRCNDTIYGTTTEELDVLMHALDVVNMGTIGLSQLASIFPLPVVKEALEETGRYTCRLRELPNELMFYFPMLMALDRSDSATDTLENLLEGNHKVFGRKSKKSTGAGGIGNARIRVGSEPLKTVFDTLCKPLSKEIHQFTHFDDLLLVAVDSVVINVPDSAKNRAHFGSSVNQNKLPAAYPQARMVGLVECGTHAIFSAIFGKYADGEGTLAKKLLPDLPRKSLLLADRLYLGWALVRDSLAQGAQILWRFKADYKDRFEIVQTLEDGSYEALYHPPQDPKSRKALRGYDFTPIPVRVCSYVVDGENPEEVHLVTTLMDHQKAPAVKLAELYMQRWEIELTFKEMKVCLNENQTKIRSLTPDLVIQELYGITMMHYAIRALMYEAAARAKLDPDVLSFTGAIKIIRRKALKGGSFSP